MFAKKEHNATPHANQQPQPAKKPFVLQKKGQNNFQFNEDGIIIGNKAVEEKEPEVESNALPEVKTGDVSAAAPPPLPVESNSTPPNNNSGSVVANQASNNVTTLTKDEEPTNTEEVTEIEEETPLKTVDPQDAQMRDSIRYYRNLTAEQKAYFQWDLVIESFRALPAHSPVSDYYLHRWARKQLRAGWSLGDAVPDLHSFRAHYGEPEVYQVTGKQVPTMYVYWYDGNRSKIRNELLNIRDYNGFWVYVDSFTGHKSVLQQRDSFAKYYDQHPITTPDIQLVFKVLELRGFPYEGNTWDVTKESRALRKAVEQVQDLLFDDKVKGYGLLTPETRKAVNDELKKIQIEKEKKFEAKKFKDVNNITALAKDPPGIDKETGEPTTGGVNLRKIPFTPAEIEKNLVFKSDIEQSFIKHLEFGTRMTILRSSIPGADGKDPGWYWVMTETGDEGYVAKHLVETNLPAPDVSYHLVTEGETLLEIARKYYSPDSEDRVGIVESDGEFRNYVLELARYNEKWRGDEAGAVFEKGADSKDPNSWKKTIVRKGLRMWIPSAAEMYYTIKGRPEDQVYDNTNWAEDGGQWIIDNAPTTMMIDAYLDWWTKVPVEIREKKVLYYYKQQLKMFKKLQVDWSWLDPYIAPLIPFVPGTGAILSTTFVYDLFISFNIGYFDYMSKSDPKRLVMNIERTLRNLTQLEHYKGVFFGFFQGLEDWGKDFLDIFVTIGDAVMTMTDILFDPETYKKIAEFTGDALEFVITNAYFIRNTLQDLSFTEAITGLMSGMRSVVNKKGKELGKSTAQALTNFAASSPYDQGFSIGRINGYLMPEIILAVATEGIYAAIKAGLKAVQVMMKFLKPILKGIKVGLKALKEALSAATEFASWISSFIQNVLKTMKKGASKFWEKMEELFEGFRKFLKKKYDKEVNLNKSGDIDVEDYTNNNKSRLRKEVKEDLDSDYGEYVEDIIKAFAIIELNDALDPSPPASTVTQFLNATIDLPKNDKFTSHHISGNLYEIKFNPKKKYTQGSDGISNRTELLNELVANGVKHNPDDIIFIGRDANGKIVFLEKGSSSAGLEHVLKHKADFVKNGIDESNIADFVFEAATNGKIIGYQGKGKGRPIFELVYNGETKRVAITIGDNGFIVGANPVSVK